MTRNRLMSYAFRLTFFILLLTGFAQMPIFKRYYIADIPGLGWLAQFYVTHVIHYVFAIIFTLWMFYAATLFLVENKGKIADKLTVGIRAALVIGILLTGFLLVMRNFPGYRFSQGFIIFLDVAHLAFAMAYLMFAGILILIRRKRS